MKLKQVFKQKQTYFILIALYLAFILFSLSIGVWYYSRMRDNIVDTTLKYNETMMEQIKSDMDRELKQINIIDYYVERNAVTQKYLKNEYLTEQEKYDLMITLNGLRSQAALLNDICIYLEDEDLIISSRNVIRAEAYFADQCKMEGYIYQTWREKYLMGLNQKKYYPVEKIYVSASIVQNIIMHKQTVLPSVENGKKVQILMMINADELKKNLDSIKRANESGIFIIDSFGKTLLSTHDSEFVFNEKNFAQRHDIVFDSSKGQYTVYVKSDYSNLIYIAQINQEMLLQDAISFKRIGLVLIALYLLLGIAILRLSGHIVYSPIRGIIEKLEKVGVKKRNSAYSDMELISVKIDNLLEEQAQFVDQIEVLNEYKRKSQLRRLLLDSDLHEQLDLIEWESEYFMVLIIRMEYVEAVEEEHGAYQLEKYGVINILSELLNAFSKGEVIDLENRYIAVIFNFDKADTKTIFKGIQEISHNMTEIVENEFNFVLNMALSGIHERKTELNKCLNEAMTALDFKTVNPEEGAVIQYDTIGSETTSDKIYYWPLNLDEIFTMYVNNGDYRSIEETVDEIIKNNLKSARYSEVVNHCIYYNLLGCFLPISTQVMNYKMAENNSYQKDKTLSENIDTIKEMFRQICSITQSQNTKNLRLLKKIDEYIDEHFNENNLSIVEIADNVQVSVQYLTSYFKKHKNTTLLKYITQKRLEYAKELLKDDSLNTNDIALMVGYTDASVFTKIFKKNENITPGKYRAALKENDLQ